jgi:hypothetical protein
MIAGGVAADRSSASGGALQRVFSWSAAACHCFPSCASIASQPPIATPGRLRGRGCFVTPSLCRGGACPSFFSADGAPQVNPARKGWVRPGLHVEHRRCDTEQGPSQTSPTKANFLASYSPLPSTFDFEHSTSSTTRCSLLTTHFFSTEHGSRHTDHGISARSAPHL